MMKPSGHVFDLSDQNRLREKAMGEVKLEPGNLMMVTLGMSENNQITMTMLMNGRPLGHMFLDKAAAENIRAGLATHISYLKEEKLDA